MKHLLIALMVACLTFSFQVGQVKEGKVSIFCPGQSKVSVAGPDGLHFVELDQYGEGSFYPKIGGDYVFECGGLMHEAKIELPDAKVELQTANEQLGLVAFGFSLLFVAIMAAAAFYISRSFLAETKFYKEIEGGKVQLVVVAGKSLDKIKIVDPVCMHAKSSILVEIPFLKAGAVWKYSYEFPKNCHLLPASLEAQQEGKKLFLLSQLIPTSAAEQKEGPLQLYSAQLKARKAQAQKRVRLPRYQVKTKEE
ncbi:MAG: hypothetical protein QXN37_01690 [Candidatus Anstonellaceae archaeon]